MKRIIWLTCIVLLMYGFVSAQDKKADAKPAPPESATIDAETVKKLQAGAKEAEGARVVAENVGLKIQLLQAELKRLTEAYERLRDESNAAFNRAAIKAGIPGGEVNQYDATVQQDGSLKLTRKPSPPKP